MGTLGRRIPVQTSAALRPLNEGRFQPDGLPVLAIIAKGLGSSSLSVAPLIDLGRANPAGDRTPSSVGYAHDADPAFEISSGVAAPAPAAGRRSDSSRRVLDAVPVRPHTGRAPAPHNPVESAPRSCPAATPHPRRRRLTLKLLVSRLEGALALTLCPFPGSGSPFWAPFDAPNRRASGLLVLRPCARPSRGPRRSLAVAPLIADQRCYGESPASLRRVSGGATVSAGRRGRC